MSAEGESAMTGSEMERLLDTRAGMALANAAWSEGAGAMLRACNADGTWRHPDNPYSAPLLAAIRDAGSAPPRPPWIDPRACWAHCAPGWRVPCDAHEPGAQASS